MHFILRLKTKKKKKKKHHYSKMDFVFSVSKHCGYPILYLESILSRQWRGTVVMTVSLKPLTKLILNKYVFLSVHGERIQFSRVNFFISPNINFLSYLLQYQLCFNKLCKCINLSTVDRDLMNK